MTTYFLHMNYLCRLHKLDIIMVREYYLEVQREQFTFSSKYEPQGYTETSGHGFGGPFPCVMDVPIPNDTEVNDRSPSETPDLAGVLGPNLPCLGLVNRAPVKFNICMFVHVYDGMRRVHSWRNWKRWFSQYVIRCSITLTVSSGTSRDERMLAPLGSK